MSVVLNLVPDSPNSQTVSLFVNGKRIGRPTALPEKLQGQALHLDHLTRALRALLGATLN